MRLLIKFSCVAAAMAALGACQEGDNTIGSSLVADETRIVIDSTFTLTGHSVTNPVVQSRTLTQLIGTLDAKEFGSISSDFVCQFLPTIRLDTAGVTPESVDSVKLVMFMNPGDFTGDSLVPMGLAVHALNKQLPSPIFSNFNPEGYYDPNPIGSKIYTGHTLHSDSLNKLNFRTIVVDLPVELGREIYRKFTSRPDIFASPEQFSNWFPGLYVTNTFGSGRMMNISETRINLYYRQKSTAVVSGVTVDTVYNRVRSYLAVTPEVITNNDITMKMSSFLTDKMAAGEALIVAPTGTEIQLTFPTREIINSYRSSGSNLSVLNDLTMSIPTSEIENNYNINPPENLLLVLSSKKDEFFAENKITDNKTSFIGVYSEANGNYVFSTMRQYILDMLDKDNLAPDDYTFTLTPVNVQTETTSSSYYNQGTTYVTTISPYVTKPAMVKLELDKAKIKFVYTRQLSK